MERVQGMCWSCTSLEYVLEVQKYEFVSDLHKMVKFVPGVYKKEYAPELHAVRVPLQSGSQNIGAAQHVEVYNTCAI